MKIALKDIIEGIKCLILCYSDKFHISQDGSLLFLELAIIQAIKDYPHLKLKYDNTKFIEGKEKNLQEFQKIIERWDEEEFDFEDLEVIGYCKNIR